MAIKWYQKYLLLMPMAYERLDLSDYDLVISNSHSCAKGIYHSKSAIHICYCYTPMRYAWSGFEIYRNSLKNRFLKVTMTFLMFWIREWDLKVNDRVDYFIAISHEIQSRIKKYYNRPSSVIFPGINEILVKPPRSASEIVPELKNKKYILSLGRLVPYKSVDLAIDACNRLKLNLLVAGNGSELNKLKKLSGSTIHFVEEFTDEEASVLFSQCDAFIFPGEEDFGMTVVEAQLHGKPVIAYGAGGVLDTVIDGVTGVLFYNQDVESVVEAISKCKSTIFDSKFVIDHAKQFSKDQFKSSIVEFVSNAIKSKGFD
jgi:glycosyltransferase involved in cell wall biosynthesis